MINLLAGLASLAGSYQAQKALGQSADSLKSAGSKAFEEGQYKPYGVTTNAGTASFDDGQATYKMSDEYQRQQDTMFGLGNAALQRAGGSYSDYANALYDQQRSLGAGSREAEAIKLRNLMSGSGMGGLQVSGQALGAGAGSGMFNPQSLEFSRAFAEQDAADRYNATQQADARMMQDLQIGQGMLSQGQGMDTAGQDYIGLGGNLASQQSAANNQAMANYLGAYTNAANLNVSRGQAIAGGLQGLGGSIGSRPAVSGSIPSNVGMFTKLSNSIQDAPVYDPHGRGTIGSHMTVDGRVTGGL